MIYVVLSAIALLVWLSRGDGPVIDPNVEHDRLLRELEIEREMKETFREAFLRQKAMYDRDIEQVRHRQTFTA
jgi:hypothetical protein